MPPEDLFSQYSRQTFIWKETQRQPLNKGIINPISPGSTLLPRGSWNKWQGKEVWSNLATTTLRILLDIGYGGGGV